MRFFGVRLLALLKSPVSLPSLLVKLIDSLFLIGYYLLSGDLAGTIVAVLFFLILIVDLGVILFDSFYFAKGVIALYLPVFGDWL